MSSQDAMCCLRVIGAAKLPLRPSKKPPNTFVKITLGSFKHKTKTIKRSREPSWNEEILFSMQSVLSVLHINLVHQSSFLRLETALGSTEIEIGRLLDKCENGEVELDLITPDGQHNPRCDGRIKLYLSTPKANVAAAFALVEARNVINTLVVRPVLRAEQFIDGTTAAFSNQSGGIQELGAVVAKLDVLMVLVDKIAEIHPYAKAAWEIVSAAYKIVKGQTVRDQKVIDLVTTMEKIYSFVDAIEQIPHKIILLEDVIRKILGHTIECARFIQDYAHRGLGERMLHGTLSDDAIKIDNLSQSLVGLKNDFDSSLAAHTALVVSHVQAGTDRLVTDAYLQKLGAADMDPSKRKECLAGTRADICQFITDWVMAPSLTPKALLLHGLAGSGKSTISTTVANYFRERGQLGAFLFFDRGVAERSDPALVVRTMAYQLGSWHPQIGESMSDAIKNTPAILSSPITYQFQKLLVDLANLPPTPSRIVLVLDALDECGTAEGREALLNILARQSVGLPSSFRVVATSRTDADIRPTFESQSHILTRELDLTSTITGQDILTYFEYHMSRISQKKGLGIDWPGGDNIRLLTERALGLFVWASTAVRFIDGYDPRNRLEIVLKGRSRSGAESALDDLYTAALESSGTWDDDDFMTNFRIILGIVLALRNPLSSTAIDSLRDNTDGRPSIDMVSQLGCVLQHSPTVRVLHPSFADFLMTKSRCRDIWLVDRVSHNRTLAIHCLCHLDKSLRRNLCNVSLSVDMENQTLSEDVTYACVFWIDHLCMVKEDIDSIMEPLNKFFTRHLLHWFEAMSILKRSRDTVALLDNLSVWILANAADQTSLVYLVRDARRFAQTFASSIAEHPLLVYLAALPFAPTTSLLYQTYHDRQFFPSISGGFQQSWPPLLLVLAEHEATVNAVVYSPDGTRIVSGSEDHTIRVWDANSGALVLPALRGHKGSVNSVAFSPNGTRIVSGSDDKTIRVWDANAGTEVLPALRGHKNFILSVAFSPKGTRIVSASIDMTIRVWDVMSGAEVLPALLGHEHWVRSVAFSPDGSRVVSGSNDHTIRVWDATSGAEILPALRGHGGAVPSVAFSPDGTRIVSGSHDNTIRIWDANLGVELVPALRGHGHFVQSVAFSPDGACIVSSSNDRTIRVWDANLGTEVLPALRGHAYTVCSAVYSPDGNNIVSASNDRTIRIWDVNSAAVVPTTVQGHEGSVFSVAFSADGKCIVSGSWDETIRVWDAISGAEVRPALRGHRGWVRSVGFSPDGTQIVSGSIDRTIRVWDIMTGIELLPALRGHRDWVTSVAFSPLGTRIVSVSNDQTIRVWDAQSGAELYAPLQVNLYGVRSVAFSPDGNRIISTSTDETILVWNAETGIQSSVIPKSQSALNTSCECPIGISRDKWIMDLPTNRAISKLPVIVELVSSAASKNLLVVGTQSGQIVILHFPPALFDISETQPFKGRGRATVDM